MRGIEELRMWWRRWFRPTRLQWLSGAVALVLLCWHFAGNVWVGRDAELRRFASPAIPSNAARLDPETVRVSLEGWFPVPQAKNVEPVKTLSLRGVFIARGSRRAAVAIIGPGGAVEGYQIVAEGQEVAKWTIKRIDRLAVTVVRGEESQELKMFPAREQGGA
jgi:hypothetical protein